MSGVLTSILTIGSPHSPWIYELRWIYFGFQNFAICADDPVHVCSSVRDYPGICGADHLEEFPDHLQDNAQWDEKSSPQHLPFLCEASSSAQLYDKNFDESDVDDQSRGKLGIAKAGNSESTSKMWFSRQVRLAL
ncbi:hypothetical protein Y032_0005g2670 [Ancylostoma ceylanicum]|uniref:Uncharacterized protein n=1 Tax=Ancylostoma ceylanicum TaxID=53326 RepID=A0A016VUQ2_9BILA|nr:hypothetical protein Y032_0005g2670 [Ancylostoma ceylanicum]